MPQQDDCWALEEQLPVGEKVSRYSSIKEIKVIKEIKEIKEIILDLENSRGVAVHLARHGDQAAFPSTQTALTASGHPASTASRCEEHSPNQEPLALESSAPTREQTGVEDFAPSWQQVVEEYLTPEGWGG